MIFATVGTNETPFDRFVAAVDTLEGHEVLVQYGSATIRPSHARGVDYLPFEDLVEHVRAADLVISHAGAGSALVALVAGSLPVLVPRLHRFGEAVDDHQLWFARRLEERGLAVVVEETGELAAAVATVSGSSSALTLQPDRLTKELRETVDRFVADRSRRPRRKAAFYRSPFDFASKETDL
jgi:UDP-N-acetylglucosamine transferase subunit ALG13